jgi:Carboxypeptidase regulatory-like domain
MKRITKCKSKHGERGLVLSLMCASVVATFMAGCAEAPYVTAHDSGSFSAAAGTSVEGVVKDPTGRPIKAADVRFEAKNSSKVVRTDARGHYICDGLAVGTYKVALVINGQVKASILDAKTQVGKATQLNFDLTGKTAPAKKHTHMVWVRPGPSTYIGGGQWIEVDDNGNIVGNIVNTTGASNVETVRRPAVYGKDIIDINLGNYTGDH